MPTAAIPVIKRYVTSSLYLGEMRQRTLACSVVAICNQLYKFDVQKLCGPLTSITCAQSNDYNADNSLLIGVVFCSANS